jgi:hypothetical protein
MRWSTALARMDLFHWRKDGIRKHPIGFTVVNSFFSLCLPVMPFPKSRFFLEIHFLLVLFLCVCEFELFGLELSSSSPAFFLRCDSDCDNSLILGVWQIETVALQCQQKSFSMIFSQRFNESPTVFRRLTQDLSETEGIVVFCSGIRSPPRRISNLLLSPVSRTRFQKCRSNALQQVPSQHQQTLPMLSDLNESVDGK